MATHFFGEEMGSVRTFYVIRVFVLVYGNVLQSIIQETPPTTMAPLSVRRSVTFKPLKLINRGHFIFKFSLLLLYQLPQ